MRTGTFSHRFLLVVTLLAMLSPLSPTPSLAQREPLLLSPMSSTAVPRAWAEFSGAMRGSQANVGHGAVETAAQAAAGNNTVSVDLRDHGPDPETTIALVGQPVVWTNNGTRIHTITEGDPVFRVYLPLVLRRTSSGTTLSASVTTSAAALGLNHTPSLTAAQSRLASNSPTHSQPLAPSTTIVFTVQAVWREQWL